MNPKVANIIALELGILIAILAWLAFSNHYSVKPRPVAEEQLRTAGSFATIAPVLKARNQRLHAADYLADRAGELLGNEEQAPVVQQYDQELATAPSSSSDPNGGVVNESLPYYAGADQEPVAYPPDYLASPVNQIAEYVQPNEIIIFSNARTFGRRNQSTARLGGGRMMVAQRRPRVRAPHSRGGGLVAPRNSNARPSRPTPGTQGSLKR
ncbi:MAG: hypothetical protein H0X34_12560 [Chthoniobacterales bacterium]|nr:hypothetical protein [Chthoniobacterales bacterium]